MRTASDSQQKGVKSDESVAWLKKTQDQCYLFLKMLYNALVVI